MNVQSATAAAPSLSSSRARRSRLLAECNFDMQLRRRPGGQQGSDGSTRQQCPAGGRAGSAAAAQCRDKAAPPSNGHATRPSPLSRNPVCKSREKRWTFNRPTCFPVQTDIHLETESRRKTRTETLIQQREREREREQQTDKET